jgi:hypothetical protein
VIRTVAFVSANAIDHVEHSAAVRWIVADDVFGAEPQVKLAL